MKLCTQIVCYDLLARHDLQIGSYELTFQKNLLLSPAGYTGAGHLSVGMYLSIKLHGVTSYKTD